MAESNLTWKFHNTFVPPYIFQDLKWYERDGLEIWYRQNQCKEFLENTDKEFERRKIVNFYMIRNGNKLDKNIMEQYQTVDHDEIKKYPIKHQRQLTSSIFGNINHKDVHVNNKTIKEYFSNKNKSLGRGKFLKRCKDDMDASCW